MREGMNEGVSGARDLEGPGSLERGDDSVRVRGGEGSEVDGLFEGDDVGGKATRDGGVIAGKLEGLTRGSRVSRKVASGPRPVERR